MKIDISNKFLFLQKSVYSTIFAYSSFLIGFSGGVDSTVLLDIMNNIRNTFTKKKDNINVISLRACYICHGTNENPSSLIVHCKKECEKRNIEFLIKKIFINYKDDNFEEKARNARYEIFKKILNKNEVLLTAHHQDDQAETFLLMLKRGSGPAGLSSMKINSSFTKKNRLLRPFLKFRKCVLKSYAKESNLKWIEDKSNYNIRFDRNFLRFKIFPIIKKRWPYFSSTVSRSAKLCSDQEQLINELLHNILKEIIFPDGSLLITPLFEMKEPKRAAILRRWLSCQKTKIPSYLQLRILWNEVVMSRQDSSAKLLLGNKEVRRFRNKLYVIPICSSNPIKKISFFKIFPNIKLFFPLYNEKRLCFEINISNVTNFLNKKVSIKNKINEILIKNNFVLFNKNKYNSRFIELSKTLTREPYESENISIKFGSFKKSIHIIGEKNKKRLKNIWNKYQIPPWKRKIIPLLFYGKKLIAALGIFVTLEGMPKNSFLQWKLKWIKK